MSQHPSSSGSKPFQHAKTPSMEFVDEDVMDVTPLCMIPGDTTGTSSSAGDKQGNTSGNSSLPKDMHYTDRAIRRLVTRILSEGHVVGGVSTPLSRREPSPEGKTHADKDDDSSRSEKEVAAEGLCSLGKTIPSKKQNVPQEDIIDLEEESTEGEDDSLVHLVKPSIAEKLRTKKGKSMANMRAARVKKDVGIGPSKPWSKVEVGKRKERDNLDSEEDVKDDVPDISPAKRKVVQKSPGKVTAVHLDNISFHLEDGAAKWKYVIQRRVAIERELGQEAVEVKEVIELIKNAGLMKSVNFKREEKIRFAEVVNAQKVMEVEGSRTSFGASKIGRTSETTMKNPSKEKELAEEFEYNSNDVQEYIDFLRTDNEEVDQVWRM
ncbi:uncharacterized protein LOC127122423 [Lathyrus oleraceus]|uniref:uncharacterized protein LOC127122423 n=1 Tax=Pisum sativum TaxID=3888 RepID=UPI0021CE82B7|nr:uncharacterized protein LOC127122423 [Pisum sativum]